MSAPSTTILEELDPTTAARHWLHTSLIVCASSQPDNRNIKTPSLPVETVTDADRESSGRLTRCLVQRTVVVGTLSHGLCIAPPTRRPSLICQAPSRPFAT